MYQKKPKRKVICKVCNEEFLTGVRIRTYCSPECKGRQPYVSGKVSTKSQYSQINGNWKRYITRLIYFPGRKKDGLQLQDLFDLIEKQNYKCALSGELLTCKLNKGTIFLTNASLDKIKPTFGYTKENIQFVQRIFNIMKWTQSKEELLENCRRLLRHNEKTT